MAKTIRTNTLVARFKVADDLYITPRGAVNGKGEPQVLSDERAEELQKIANTSRVHTFIEDAPGEEPTAAAAPSGATTEESKEGESASSGSADTASASTGSRRQGRS